MQYMTPESILHITFHYVFCGNIFLETFNQAFYCMTNGSLKERSQDLVKDSH